MTTRRKTDRIARQTALICSACWPQATTMHPCRHGRRFLHLIASSVSVRAAYAFGDWPPIEHTGSGPTRSYVAAHPGLAGGD